MMLALSPVQAVTLRFAPRASSNLTYSQLTDTKQRSAQGSVNFSQKATLRVQVVQSGASGVQIVQRVQNTDVTVPAGSPLKGMEKNIEQQANAVVLRSRYNARAQPIDIKSAGGGAAAGVLGGLGQSGMGFMGITYPATPVKVGSTWRGQMDLGAMFSAGAPGMFKSGGQSKIPIVYRLLRFGNSGGRRTADVSITMKGVITMKAQNGQTISMNTNSVGTAMIDVATGMPMLVDTNGTNRIKFGAMGEMNQAIRSRTVLKSALR